MKKIIFKRLIKRFTFYDSEKVRTITFQLIFSYQQAYGYLKTKMMPKSNEN